MENSKETIGNRTRYIPACNIVPQPTAPPRVLYFGIQIIEPLKLQIIFNPFFQQLDLHSKIF